MTQEAVRRRFAAWIHRSRLRRFCFYFPAFTLVCYWVQYFVDHVRKSNLGWSFPLLFGIAMGLNFEFSTPNSITDALKRTE